MNQLELGLEIEAAELPETLLRTLQELYEEGYRYLARDKGMDSIACFSLKPKKYSSLESWGYDNPDARGVLPAYPILDSQVPGVKWSNKSATLIEIYLGVRE